MNSAIETSALDSDSVVSLTAVPDVVEPVKEERTEDQRHLMEAIAKMPPELSEAILVLLSSTNPNADVANIIAANAFLEEENARLHDEVEALTTDDEPKYGIDFTDLGDQINVMAIIPHLKLGNGHVMNEEAFLGFWRLALEAWRTALEALSASKAQQSPPLKGPEEQVEVSVTELQPVIPPPRGIVTPGTSKRRSDDRSPGRFKKFSKKAFDVACGAPIR